MTHGEIFNREWVKRGKMSPVKWILKHKKHKKGQGYFYSFADSTTFLFYVCEVCDEVFIYDTVPDKRTITKGAGDVE